MDRYLADILLTMGDGDAPPIRSGAVDVEAGRVIWSGAAAEAPTRTNATVHEIAGILMPGMVDIHCHTPMVLLRGAGEGLPVDRWLREVMWPREAKLTAEDVRMGMLVGGAELLRNGITTSVEMYFHGQGVAEGADEVGLRCIVTPPIIEDPQLDRFGSWELQLDEMVALRARWSSNERIDVGLGPHSADSLSEACLRRIAEIGGENGMLVHIHVAEQEGEDAAVQERTGMSVPEYIEALGLLEANVLAAHSVWMSDHDIDVFARNEVAVAHCPCSNMKHGSGAARIDDMLAAGIRIGIATDGPASHHRLDLFEEMRTAIRLARVQSCDAERLPTERALRMVTAGAADAINRSDLGSLTPGSHADMVALDGSAPALNPVLPNEDDPISRVVWSGSPSAISGVWVAGRKVVENQRVTTIDAAALTGEMARRAERLADPKR